MLSVPNAFLNNFGYDCYGNQLDLDGFDEATSIDFYLNYVAKIVSNDISEEAQMIYKLKYDNVYPVKNLKSYMENLFK